MDGCKEMHGVWKDTLAMKHGHGNGMLYELTIGEKSFAKWELQSNGCGHGFVFRFFHFIC